MLGPLSPPGVLGTPTHHGDPLPVPIQATETQGREQGEGAADQDERQDPHGQHFGEPGRKKEH